VTVRSPLAKASQTHFAILLSGSLSQFPIHKAPTLATFISTLFPVKGLGLNTWVRFDSKGSTVYRKGTGSGSFSPASSKNKMETKKRNKSYTSGNNDNNNIQSTKSFRERGEQTPEMLKY